MLFCPKCSAPCLRNHRYCPSCGADLTEAAAARSLGESLVDSVIGGRFVLREIIGSGGMGKVFRAEHVGVGRTVAVKIMHKHLLGDATAAARFTNEALAASALNHPHSIGILDFGQTEAGVLFIVMEHLLGQSLDAVMRRTFPLPLSRVAHIMCQSLDAVEAAHQQNIIHRDLKPENIFLLENRARGDFVKVLDFGIAKILNQDGRAVTTPGLVPGTPEYMSPEQARGEPLDPRSDVYAMGVILYELLTGSVPFKGASAIATMMSHVQDPVEPPSSRRPDLQIPPALDAVVTWALAKDVGERLASAHQFRDVLSAWAHVAGLWVAEVDARASSPDVLLEFLTADELTAIPGEVSREQRAALAAEEGFLGGAAGGPVARRSDCLVGRDGELQRLMELINSSGRRMLRIEGELGIGRSRLVGDVISKARAEDHDVLHIRPQQSWVPQLLGSAQRFALQCLGLDPSKLELGGIVTAAEQIGLDPAEVPGLLDLFTLPTPVAEFDRDSRRRERFRAFCELAERAAATKKSPVFVFEHLEAFDAPSRELIGALIERMRHDVAVIITHAPDEALTWPEGVELLTLEALSEADGETLARTMFEGAVDETLCERLGASGLPLFVEQLAFAVAFEDLTEPPERLADLVASRVDRLAKGDRFVLQWIAVLNEPASAELLAHLSDQQIGSSQLEALVERGFLRAMGGQYAFEHQLIGIVVYSSIPAGARRSMHQSVADALRTDGAPIGLVAYHAYQADDGHRAIEELDRAGMWSHRCLDLNGAIAQFTQALDLVRREWGRGRIPAEDLDQLAVDLALRLAGVLRETGHSQMAEGVLEEILSVAAGDDYARARLRLNLGLVDVERGNPQRALRHLQLAQVDARRAQSHRLIEVITRELAHAHALMGQRDAAGDLLAEALEESKLAAGYLPGGPPWEALVEAATTCVEIGYPERARGYLHNALEGAELEGSKLGELKVLSCMAEVHLSKAEWDEAEQTVQRSLDLARQVGDRTRQAQLLMGLGRVRRIKGKVKDGRHYLEEAVEICKAIAWPEGVKQAEDETDILGFAAPANS